ncbi:MAG TPA: pyridoxamine 5'-phosphate oxidase family protein [Kiritimatiellia bacterium]|jgi:hypothetical protein
MFYHDGSRDLQDRFGTRKLADRLEKVTVHEAFTDEDRAFIESSAMFFLSTVDAEGQPDCSYKGGMPGFVKIVDECTLAFPDYDGNGMFRSLGNMLANPRVALLFVDFGKGDRMRINGTAEVRADDPLLASFPGAQMVVRVRATRIFPNCPRYIHKMELVEYSTYAPRDGHVPPVPGWKKNPAFRDVVPPA